MTEEYRACSVSVQCVRLKEEPDLEHEYDASAVSACVNTVKEEPDQAEYGDSTAAWTLYAGHEIKDELVFGPEQLQPPDYAFSLPKRVSDTQECFEDKHWTRAHSDYLPDKVKHVDSRSCSTLSGKVKPKNMEISSEKTSKCMESWSGLKNSHPGLCLKTCSVRLERLPHSKKKQANKTKFSKSAIRKDKNEMITKLEDGADNNVYSCGTVQEQFPRKRSFVPHISHSFKRDKKDGFKCEICLRKFIRHKNLVRHVQIHIGMNIHECEICKKQFLYKGSWVQHLKKHKSKETSHSYKMGKPYICEICLRKFARHKNLVRHIQIHNQRNTHECEICKKSFLEKWKLVRHMKKYKYKCEICSKMFKSSFLLEKHTGKHERQARLQCKYCKIKLSKLSRLIEHEQSHTGEKPYKCGICLGRFARKRYAAKHMKTCTNEPRRAVSSRYKCDICMRLYASSLSLKNHRRRHYSTYYSCEACRGRFHDKEKLGVHIHSICESLSCAICGLRFEGRGLLLRHARAHI